MKKCPFCGEEKSVELVKDEIHNDDECGYFIICNARKGGCGAMSGWGGTIEKVVKKWEIRKGCLNENN